MSYDISLTCDCCGSELVDRNYTYNVSPMLSAAADSIGFDTKKMSVFGWLDGKSGPDGGQALLGLFAELTRDPDRYEALNPPNGWGNYGGLCNMLRELYMAVPECPTTWKVT